MDVLETLAEDATEGPEGEAERAPDPPTPPPSPAPPSAPASSPGTEAQQLKLLRENLALLFREVQGHGEQMRRAAETHQRAAEELRGVTELLEMVVRGLDQHTQRLGTATLSLSRIERAIRGSASR